MAGYGVPVGEVAAWSSGFQAFVGGLAGRFPRVESRRQAVGYLRGLLGESERKNGWTLAEAAGDTGPERMQRLLMSRRRSASRRSPSSRRR